MRVIVNDYRFAGSKYSCFRLLLDESWKECIEGVIGNYKEEIVKGTFSGDDVLEVTLY